MDLDEFVEKTLLSITNGVARAQEKSLLFIAPGYVEGKKIESGQMVSFEVVVTTSKEAGGGIKVFSLGEAKAGVSSQAVNRVSFEVPIYFQAPTILNDRHYLNDETGEEEPSVDVG